MPFSVVFPALMALAASGFLVLGVHGLLGHRPLVFRSRRMLVPILLCLLPGSLAPFLAGIGSRGVPLPPVLIFLPLAVDAGALAIVVYALRGYMVLGADDHTLATALKEALRQLGLPFEESLGSLRLPTLAADLKLLQQGATGSAQLRMEPEHAETLDRVAAALRAALATGGGRFRPLVFAAFTFAGLVLLAVGGALALAR